MAKISHHGSCRQKYTTELKCICAEKSDRWNSKCWPWQCQTNEIRQHLYWNRNKTAMQKSPEDIQATGLFTYKRFTTQKINIGYLKKETRPSSPNPQRCFQCQKFGHTKNSCKGKAVCAGCGEEGHNLDDCQNDPKCVNCQGDHVAISRDCPKWKIEKDIVTLNIQKRFHSQMLTNVYNPLSTHQRIHMQL